MACSLFVYFQEFFYDTTHHVALTLIASSHKRMDIIIIKCNGNSAFCLGYVKISSLRRLYVVIIVYPFIGQDLFTEDKFYFYGVLIPTFHKRLL